MAQRASWHVLPSILENRTQKHPKLASLQHFEVDILEIFKNESFRFPQFPRNFVYNKFSFCGTLGFLTCFSVDPRKPHSKIPKTTLYLQHFEVDILIAVYNNFKLVSHNSNFLYYNNCFSSINFFKFEIL